MLMKKGNKTLINEFAVLEDYFFGGISFQKYTIENESAVYITDIERSYFRLFLQRHQHANPKTDIENLQELFAKHQIENWVYVLPERFHTPILQNTLLEMGFNFEEQSTAMIYEIAENQSLLGQNTLVIENVNADNSAWLNILQEAFGGNDKTSEQYGNALLSAAVKGVDMHHFIGLENNNPVVAITLTFLEDSVRIDNVACHPNYQRLGYASQMMQFALKLVLSKAIKHVFFEASSKGLGIYKRIGFKELFTNYTYSKGIVF